MTMAGRPSEDLVFTDDNDDEPLVFKRNSTTKQNKSCPEARRPPPSSSQSSNGQNSNPQKCKTAVTSLKASSVKSPVGSPKPSTSSAKPSSVKSPVGSPKPSTSSAKPSSVKSPVGSPKPSTSSAKPSPMRSPSPVKSPLASSKGPNSSHDQLKLPPKNSVSSSIKKEINPVKRESESRIDDEDSEDDKPLMNRMNKTVGKDVGARIPVKDEDSDDEKFLADKFKAKQSAGTSGSKINNPNEKKPVAQNGSASKEKLQKPSTIPIKRSADGLNSSNQPSSKKPKIADQSTAAKVKQVGVKAEQKVNDDEDDIPLAQRKKVTVSSDRKLSSVKQKAIKPVHTSFKKTNTKINKQMKNSKYSKSTKVQPGSTDGQKKWTTLVHSGVIFPPPYKPHGIKILCKGKPVNLTPQQEEVATMFAVMKETDYMQKPKFLENFWNDWRKLLGKNHVIQKLEDCDFTPIYDWHQLEKEKKKQMTTEEKKALKEEKLKQEEKYMYAIVDGVKEKVGNFRVEPPGLFRGRGEHPKMGKLKRRIHPKDITINIGKDAPIPECPIPGESWKEVKHDNTVTWLAFWNDPINQKEFKYVFLAASSSLKGQSDKEKYEKARMLKDYIHNIRAAYTKDFTSKDVTKRQIAVATYLIDKLALRAGNEKDDDEADTVGCCTLKVANVECVPPRTLKFDFLGKDSIRYENSVEVELPVYKAIGTFQAGKKPTDDLFDQLDTSRLNAHLKELMPALTAKVFRTYNASITLDDKLYEETEDGDVAEKVVVYNHANKEVAIICNHQRTISKSHGAQMSKLTEKIEELKATIKELRVDLDRAKKGKAPLKDSNGKQKRNLSPEAIEKKIASTNQKIEKMEIAMKTKEDLKTVALGTSKINYLDPRITVAWCKRHEVPIEKIFNKSLLAKFAWAMDVDPQFRF